MVKKVSDDPPDLDATLGEALAAAIVPATIPGDRRAAMRERVLARARGGLRTVRATGAAWVPTSPLTELRALRPEDGDAQRTVVFRLKPGGEIAAHLHRFEEETYVVEGEIEVGGETLRAGDYQFAAPGSFHETIRSPHGATLLIRYQTQVA